METLEDIQNRIDSYENNLINETDEGKKTTIREVIRELISRAENKMLQKYIQNRIDKYENMLINETDEGKKTTIRELISNATLELERNSRGFNQNIFPSSLPSSYVPANAKVQDLNGNNVNVPWNATINQLKEIYIDFEFVQRYNSITDNWEIFSPNNGVYNFDVATYRFGHGDIKLFLENGNYKSNNSFFSKCSKYSKLE